MKQVPAVILTLFIADFIIDSIIAAYADISFRYISKGLLMPLLFAFFITGINDEPGTGNKKYKRLIFLGLIFSFLGDLFLIEEGRFNFIFGIAAFLMAQLCYIILFTSIESFSKRHILFLLVSASIILCYLFILNYLFYPLIIQRSLLIPVLVYSLVLGLMLFTSINLQYAVQLSKKNRFCFIAGAIIFVISDSMIGFNSFYLSAALPGFYIMITYCIAQFLIISGTIKFIKNNKSRTIN